MHNGDLYFGRFLAIHPIPCTRAALMHTSPVWFLTLIPCLRGPFVVLLPSSSSAAQRRRDRINDRMKALQELIPNSNKVGRMEGLKRKH